MKKVVSVVLVFLFCTAVYAQVDQVEKPKLTIPELVYSVNCRSEVVGAALDYAKKHLESLNIKYSEEKMLEYIRSVNSNEGFLSEFCFNVVKAGAQ